MKTLLPTLWEIQKHCAMSYFIIQRKAKKTFSRIVNYVCISMLSNTDFTRCCAMAKSIYNICKKWYYKYLFILNAIITIMIYCTCIIHFHGSYLIISTLFPAWSSEEGEKDSHYRLTLSKMSVRHSDQYTCTSPGGHTNTVSIKVVSELYLLNKVEFSSNLVPSLLQLVYCLVSGINSRKEGSYGVPFFTLTRSKCSCI